MKRRIPRSARIAAELVMHRAVLALPTVTLIRDVQAKYRVGRTLATAAVFRAREVEKRLPAGVSA